MPPKGHNREYKLPNAYKLALAALGTMTAIAGGYFLGNPDAGQEAARIFFGGKPAVTRYAGQPQQVSYRKLTSKDASQYAVEKYIKNGFVVDEIVGTAGKEGDDEHAFFVTKLTNKDSSADSEVLVFNDKKLASRIDLPQTTVNNISVMNLDPDRRSLVLSYWTSNGSNHPSVGAMIYGLDDYSKPVLDVAKWGYGADVTDLDRNNLLDVIVTDTYVINCFACPNPIKIDRYEWNGTDQAFVERPVPRDIKVSYASRVMLKLLEIYTTTSEKNNVVSVLEKDLGEDVVTESRVGAQKIYSAKQQVSSITSSTSTQQQKQQQIKRVVDQDPSIGYAALSSLYPEMSDYFQVVSDLQAGRLTPLEASLYVESRFGVPPVLSPEGYALYAVQKFAQHYEDLKNQEADSKAMASGITSGSQPVRDPVMGTYSVYADNQRYNFTTTEEADRFIKERQNAPREYKFETKTGNSYSSEKFRGTPQEYQRELQRRALEEGNRRAAEDFKRAGEAVNNLFQGLFGGKKK